MEETMKLELERIDMLAKISAFNMKAELFNKEYGTHIPIIHVESMDKNEPKINKNPYNGIKFDHRSEAEVLLARDGFENITTNTWRKGDLIVTIEYECSNYTIEPIERL